MWSATADSPNDSQAGGHSETRTDHLRRRCGDKWSLAPFQHPAPRQQLRNGQRGDVMGFLQNHAGEVEHLRLRAAGGELEVTYPPSLDRARLDDHRPRSPGQGCDVRRRPGRGGSLRQRPQRLRRADPAVTRSPGSPNSPSLPRSRRPNVRCPRAFAADSAQTQAQPVPALS